MLRTDACVALRIRKKSGSTRQLVFKFGASSGRIEDRRTCTVANARAGTPALFLRAAANLPRPEVPLEGYAAFFLLACELLDTGLAGFNFGHCLFVPGAPTDRCFLSQAETGADGQAAFCFPAVGPGVASAWLALPVIDI